MCKIPVKTALLVESDPADARLFGEMFQHQGSYSFAMTQVNTLAEAERRLSAEPVEVILLSLDCPDATSLEAVRRIHAAARGASIVLLSSQRDEAMAIRAMDEGVQDYLIKGQIEAHELMRAMRNSVARKVLEETLFKEKSRAQVTLDSIGDAVICTDISGNISFLNPMAERLTGWSLKDAAGQPLAGAFRIMDALTGQVAANPTTTTIGTGRPTHLPLNCVLTRRDGHQIFIEDSVAPICDRDGLASGSVLVFRDVTVARALAEQIAHLAEHDSLTGLPNRVLLNDRLDQAIARAARDRGRVAVMFLDLDGFKHINDSLGHPAGDRVLQSVAARLRVCIRNPDTVSRQGGDEFIVLIQDIATPEDAAIAARRLLDAVAEPHSIDNHTLHLSTSIGVSVYPEDGLNSETLIKNADTAMYQAKQHGRSNFRFFKQEMNVRAVARQSIEEDLRHALNRGEFALHYQPKINLKTGRICGAEALLRWKHPTRGDVPPLQFIPIAEDCGLILPIGAWVLREACVQAKAWADAGLCMTNMAVNVSAVQFNSDVFLLDLTAILDETGLAPKSLEIEVTESVLMERSEQTAPTLRVLRERGVRVSVDDFGTGYSSLSYLRNLPLDALKIDQSFVRQISAGPEDTTLVSAIISMGRSLKLQVIAEGVEKAEELAFLKAEGCDEAQGFYFSRPLPAAEFGRLLASGASRDSDVHAPSLQ